MSSRRGRPPGLPDLILFSGRMRTSGRWIELNASEGQRDQRRVMLFDSVPGHHEINKLPATRNIRFQFGEQYGNIMIPFRPHAPLLLPSNSTSPEPCCWSGRYEQFEGNWLKYPAIAKLWSEHWERVIPFFACPEKVRKAFYTTNAVASLHMSLRKIIKTRGSLPSEEAAFKLLYLALTKVAAKWETVQNWKQMLNYLDTVCGDRIREAGVRL
jgi:hypothetical protein